MKEQELEAQVEAQLKEANLRYVRQPVVGKVQPDFLIRTEHDDPIVVEVKAWDSSPENTARAINQSRRYKELSDAAAALIVTLAGEPVSLATGGVVGASALLPALATLATQLAKRKGRPKAPASRPIPKKKVFASMPFAGQYDDTFLVAIQPAALALNAAADRVDHTGQSGNVVDQIKQMIRFAKVVVADLSESRPNVLHEVEFAEANGKPVIQICSTDTAQLPFNVRNNQTIKYSLGQVSKLRSRLEAELKKEL